VCVCARARVQGRACAERQQYGWKLTSGELVLQAEHQQFTAVIDVDELTFSFLFYKLMLVH